MPNIKVYKIFYDETSRRQISPPFLPMDNCDGPAGWFELWPILKFLEAAPLQDNVWYGFVSPKFPEKAEVTYQQVESLIAAHPDADVALFTYNWVKVALERNVWTESSYHHPGLTTAMEGFLRSMGNSTKIDDVYTTFDTAVFSNYVIAKRNYWESWRDLARRYVDYVESGGPELLDNQSSEHTGAGTYMIKTFVQERLVTWLLTTKDFKVVRPDYTRDVPLPKLMQPKDSLWLRLLLRIANASKSRYLRSNARTSLLGYKIARRLALRILLK